MRRVRVRPGPHSGRAAKVSVALCASIIALALTGVASATEVTRETGSFSGSTGIPAVGSAISTTTTVIRFSDGEVLKVTPGTHNDFSLICTALGGEPV